MQSANTSPLQPGTTSITSQLPIGVYRLHFNACHAGKLPDATGSAWRGALGRNLRRAVCRTPDLKCGECMLRKRCSYSLCFKPGASLQRKGRFASLDAPPPFTLFQPHKARQIAKGDPVTLELTLIGDNPQLLPALAYALIKPRLTPQSGESLTLALQRIDWLENTTCGLYQAVWCSGSWLKEPSSTHIVTPNWLSRTPSVGIRFLSPVRIKHRGRMVEDGLSGELFIINLLRRISLLSECWAQQEIDVDGEEIKAASSAVREQESTMKLWSGTRYSVAQHRRMPINGLLGELQIGTAAIASLLPLLWLGQWLHIGKGCSFGQGRYELFETCSGETSAETPLHSIG